MAASGAVSGEETAFSKVTKNSQSIVLGFNYRI